MNVIVALQRHQLAAWGRLLADADELLRNAQYAFHNVGYGSTNSKKFASRAGSLARRIIRKYPASPEAAAARSILESLGERLPKPAAQFQHVHSRTNEHRSHVPAGDRSAVLRNLSSASGWLMPGWPLRLMQAIPVVVGAIFVFQGLSVFWYWQPNVESAFLIAAGGILIYSPKLNVFTDFVNYAKTRTFVKEDWDANANDMPTVKDIVELVRPFCMATAASASLLFLHSFS